VPTLTAFVCWVALRVGHRTSHIVPCLADIPAQEPFTIKEALAGLIAFIGVLFVARPTFLFPYYGKHDSDTTQQDSSGGGLLPPAEATPAERAIAIVCAVFGSFCAASAYATIRVIGKRVHSLVSVNYFAVMATVSSALIILIHPGLQFEIPQTTTQW
jgi:drug/metabolite transporter (DMT)-like permease